MIILNWTTIGAWIQTAVLVQAVVARLLVAHQAAPQAAHQVEVAPVVDRLLQVAGQVVAAAHRVVPVVDLVVAAARLAVLVVARLLLRVVDQVVAVVHLVVLVVVVVVGHLVARLLEVAVVAAVAPAVAPAAAPAVAPVLDLDQAPVAARTRAQLKKKKEQYKSMSLKN
jgi:hypothetical protein